MRYDLIAGFYRKADDTTPAYSSPLGTISWNIMQFLSKNGFSEDPESTPGYLDYINRDACEKELQGLTHKGYISEILDILSCGEDFERIEIKAREIEVIDDEGTIPPCGFFIYGTFVKFEKTEPLSPVQYPRIYPRGILQPPLRYQRRCTELSRSGSGIR